MPGIVIWSRRLGGHVAGLMVTAQGRRSGGLSRWLVGKRIFRRNRPLVIPALDVSSGRRARVPSFGCRAGDLETITFLLLGALGWAELARVVRAAVVAMRRSEFMLQARASGSSGVRIVLIHLLPNLRPVLITQFLISIPLFILSEANLGLLGLGVAEPMPSWGNLLRDLERFSEVRTNPWLLAPAGMLVVVVFCFQIVARRENLAA